MSDQPSLPSNIAFKGLLRQCQLAKIDRSCCHVRRMLQGDHDFVSCSRGIQYVCELRRKGKASGAKGLTRLELFGSVTGISLHGMMGYHSMELNTRNSEGARARSWKLGIWFLAAFTVYKRHRVEASDSIPQVSPR